MKLFLSTLCLGGAAAAGSAGLQDPVATDAPRSLAVRLAPSAVSSTADAPQEGARRLAALGYVSTQDDETKKLEKAAQELEGEVARLRGELESMRKRLAEDDAARTDARDRMETARADARERMDAARQRAEETRRSLEEARAQVEESRGRARGFRFRQLEEARSQAEQQILEEAHGAAERLREVELRARAEGRARSPRGDGRGEARSTERRVIVERSGDSDDSFPSIQRWLSRAPEGDSGGAPTSITIHVEEGDVHIHVQGSSIQTQVGSGSSKAPGAKDRVSGLSGSILIGSEFPEGVETRVYRHHDERRSFSRIDPAEIVEGGVSLDGEILERVLELKDLPIARIFAPEEIESAFEDTIKALENALELKEFQNTLRFGLSSPAQIVLEDGTEVMENVLEGVRMKVDFGEDGSPVRVWTSGKSFEGDGGTFEVRVGPGANDMGFWRVFGSEDEEVEASEIEASEVEEIEEILEEVEASEHRFVFGLPGAAAGGIVPAAASGFSFGGAAAAPAPAGDELLDLAREICDELRAMRAELEALRSDLTAGPAGRTAPAAFFAAPAPPPATPARPTAPAHPSAPAPPSPPSIPVAAPPAPPAADGFLVGRGEFPTPPAAPTPQAARGGR